MIAQRYLTVHRTAHLFSREDFAQSPAMEGKCLGGGKKNHPYRWIGAVIIPSSDPAIPTDAQRSPTAKGASTMVRFIVEHADCNKLYPIEISFSTRSDHVLCHKEVCSRAPTLFSFPTVYLTFINILMLIFCTCVSEKVRLFLSEYEAVRDLGMKNRDKREGEDGKACIIPILIVIKNLDHQRECNLYKHPCYGSWNRGPLIYCCVHAPKRIKQKQILVFFMS